MANAEYDKKLEGVLGLYYFEKSSPYPTVASPTLQAITAIRALNDEACEVESDHECYCQDSLRQEIKKTIGTEKE